MKQASFAAAVVLPVLPVLSLGAFLCGCHFDVAGIDLPSAFTVDGGIDGSMPDGAMKPGFVPSNVSPTHVQEGASSLAAIHDLDTEKLTIDGAPPPAGVVFVPEATHDEWAVLSVRDLTIDGDVKVHGRRALVIVSVGEVRIDGILHGEASLRTPGPGGQFTGAGRGGDGKTSQSNHSGGGGGGHGAPGAAGGTSEATVNGEGGLGGPTFPALFSGGSGGGDGAGASATGSSPCPVGQGYSAGGAGGGAIQISAKLSIDLGAMGGINTGGGGGRGGCLEVPSAGGGGGSGGTIWLEAPTMHLLGKLAANGGGGGSGAQDPFLDDWNGKDGKNGALALTAAAGGMSVGNDSGEGGAGGIGGVDAKPGGHAHNGGGGGGAVGQIRIRTRAVAPVTDPATVISPAPQLGTDF